MWFTESWSLIPIGNGYHLMHECGSPCSWMHSRTSFMLNRMFKLLSPRFALKHRNPWESQAVSCVPHFTKSVPFFPLQLCLSFCARRHSAPLSPPATISCFSLSTVTFITQSCLFYLLVLQFFSMLHDPFSSMSFIGFRVAQTCNCPYGSLFLSFLIGEPDKKLLQVIVWT